MPAEYDQIADRYDAGRAEPLDGLGGWRDAVRPHLDPGERAPVVDIGAGTGVFSTAFAGWFGVRVVGVEPSAGMRARARRERAHPRVAYVGGRGEQLPLRTGSVQAAWLSTVIHHLEDPAATAAELRRVLPRGAPVMIRSLFPGRPALDELHLFAFFPGARQIAETFPTVDDTVGVFARCGFAFESVTAIPQTNAPSLRAFCNMARERTDTLLRRLPDGAFAAGLAELERAATEEGSARPVLSRLDLLVLR